MENKFLPIGSVVRLKGGEKKLMITSYLIFPNGNKENIKMFEYGACGYPLGVLDSKHSIGFNHDQIEEIIFMGYIDDDQKELNDALNKSEEQIKNGLINALKQ